MNKTDGHWDPSEPFVFFIAGGPSFLIAAEPYHTHCLVAVNELMREEGWEEELDLLMDGNRRLLLDSGAFSLCSAHARDHNISLDDAFKIPLKDLDGFEELWKRYVEIARKYADRLWGVVEVDLGGEKQKRETRKRLHDLGINPIPVLHTLNDSEEYYDELMEGFDRICAGNIVQSSSYARKRILETLSRKRKGKPVKWIHLLGMTPNEILCAFPFESCDSSAWLNTVRWSGYVEKACLRSVGHLPKNFQYELGNRDSWALGVKMGAIGANYYMRNMRLYRKAVPR